MEINAQPNDKQSQDNGLATVSLTINRGPLSPTEQGEFVSDLAQLLGVPPSEVAIVKQVPLPKIEE